MHPSAGGPPVVVENLCLQAACSNWQASVISTARLCADDGSELSKSLNRRIKTRILPIRRFTPVDLFLPRFADAIESEIEASDLVHLHTLWHPLNRAARTACNRLRRKFVLSPHGMLDPYSLGIRTWLKRIYLAGIERQTLTQAASLIFTSAEEQRLAREAVSWLPAGRVIPLGADSAPQNACATAIQAKFPQLNGRPSILFLGRLHEKKGLLHVIHALPALMHGFPDVVLVAAGTGHPAFTNTLQQAAHDLGLADHVLFTGFLEGDLKWGAMAVASAFVLPSAQENFAIAVAEAMHAGLPVIITDRVNISATIEQQSAGIVLRSRGEQLTADLARALSHVLSHRDEARRMGERGRAVAKREFTWEQCASSTFQLYNEILQERVSDTAAISAAAG
jgi:glycosyltransferase involved in cell wall biosynthesis